MLNISRPSCLNLDISQVPTHSKTIAPTESLSSHSQLRLQKPHSPSRHTPAFNRSCIVACSPCTLNMSFALLAMTIFLGPSLVVAFVLPPSQEETEASTIPLVSGRNGCQSDVSMATIRKRLLESLNLQTEPQLPAGQLTSIREQWKNMFSATDHKSKGPTVSEISETHGGGNSTALKCCQMASQILLKDLGWDNWVIYPETFTFVQCTSCYQNTARCPSHPSTVDENTSQIQCCEPMSKEMVPIVYMDDLSTLVISSVQLTRTCGCGQGKLHSDE